MLLDPDVDLPLLAFCPISAVPLAEPGPGFLRIREELGPMNCPSPVEQIRELVLSPSLSGHGRKGLVLGLLVRNQPFGDEAVEQLPQCDSGRIALDYFNRSGKYDALPVDALTPG